MRLRLHPSGLNSEEPRPNPAETRQKKQSGGKDDKKKKRKENRTSTKKPKVRPGRDDAGEAAGCGLRVAHSRDCQDSCITGLRHYDKAEVH